MRKNLPAIIVLVVTIIGTACGFYALWPNEGPARFRSDVITVNATAAGTWGAEISPLHSWGVPIEFVDGEADITFVIGETPCQEVPGFGKACVAGEAIPVFNSRNWVTKCTITLTSRGTNDTKEATAVVTHEFGHCLGAEHNDAQDSIMGSVMPSKSFTPEHWSWNVTDNDRSQVAVFYGE